MCDEKHVFWNPLQVEEAKYQEMMMKQKEDEIKIEENTKECSVRSSNKNFIPCM